MTQVPGPTARFRCKTWIGKAVRFVAVALVFGWFYAWASPRAFPRDMRAGFALGALHGALMPMALPSLVMGQDVEIYAPENTGRPYKLGYIVGIDVCGLFFFGALFWRPGRKGIVDAPSHRESSGSE